MNEERELTPEQRIMTRYMDLGREIRELTEERENIRDSELLPMMLEDGISFELDGQRLRFEFVEKVDFDHKAARANGDISDDVWCRYTSVKIERRLMARKTGDEAAKQAEEQLLAQMAALAKEARKK